MLPAVSSYWTTRAGGLRLTGCVGLSGVLLSLRLLQGSLAQLRRDSPLLLKHAAVTRKLGFPDIIMPGDVRYVPRSRRQWEVWVGSGVRRWGRAPPHGGRCR